MTTGASRRRAALIAGGLVTAAAVCGPIWIVLQPVGNRDRERLLQTGATMGELADILEQRAGASESWRTAAVENIIGSPPPLDGWGHPVDVALFCDGDWRRFTVRSAGQSILPTDDLVLRGPKNLMIDCELPSGRR